MDLEERERDLVREVDRLDRRIGGLRRRGRSGSISVEDLNKGVDEVRNDLYALCAVQLGGTYTCEDVRGWYERVEEVTGRRPGIGEALMKDLLHMRKVPNAALRHRAEELERREALSATVEHIHEHLLHLEKIHGENYGSDSLKRGGHDLRILKRWLGMSPTHGKDDYRNSLRIWLRYEQAVAVARGFDLDPTEVGL